MRGALHFLQMVCLDADVTCWVTVRRLWASLRVGMVACFIWSGGVSVWCADGPWLGGFALCLSVGAGGCHVNKVT